MGKSCWQTTEKQSSLCRLVGMQRGMGTARSMRLSGGFERQAAEIAKAAMSVPAAARAGIISARCEGDDKLAARVREMLTRHEQATLAGVSQSPVTLVHESATVVGESGGEGRAADGSRGLLRLGQYAVLKVLGEGGMGVVYLAQQERPKRTVALKVIRPGMLSPRMLKRFEHESSMLARLQHPGIAQIFEASTAQTSHGPQPFFAMEYVQGSPLNEYAKAKGLDDRAKLTLFVRVCEAVHHAHQKGVIHRDLKPGNILVDLGGQPKILDFGVARATDADVQTATMQTGAGELVGTLPYMSPEQIAGDPGGLDTRSDVYTLGVILFQLLADRLPHDVPGKSVPEAVRLITQQEPTQLSTVRRELRGDVATLTHKALERDKTRRYQSASELSADIQRFLRDEPIAARPPSTVYQVSKFASRNRGLVAAIAAAFALLCAGIAGTTFQAIEATRGRTLAQRQTELADAARAEAKLEARNAEAVSEFLTTMLASADVESTGNKDVSVREVLDAAAGTMDLSATDRPAKVEVSIRGALSSTYRGVGEYAKAHAQATRALTLAEQAFGPEADVTIEAVRALGNIEVVRGNFEEAERLTLRAVTLIEAKSGDASPDAAVARSEHARVMIETGRWGEALPMLERSLETLISKEGEASRRTQTVMHTLGFALKSAGRFDDSIAMLMRAVAASAKSFGADHPQTLYELNTLAATMQRAGRNAEAAGRFRELVEKRSRVVGSDHPSTINAMSNLSVALIADGKLDEGEPLVRKCLESFEKSLGEGHPKTLIARGNLAYVLEDRGNLGEAESLYRKTLDVLSKGPGGQDPETWSAINNLAMLLMRQDRASEAEPMLRRLIEMCREKLPAGHFYTAIYENNLGECLTKTKKYEEAEQLLLGSLPSLEKTFKPGHPRLTRGVQRLIDLFTSSGQDAKVQEWKTKLPAK
jgi:eukaryotic-like serine/threonine-protein kinase